MSEVVEAADEQMFGLEPLAYSESMLLKDLSAVAQLEGLVARVPSFCDAKF